MNLDPVHVPLLLANLIGGWEVILIVAVLLVWFGAKGMSDLGRGLRQGMAQFWKAAQEVSEEINRNFEPPSPEQSAPSKRTISYSDEFTLWIAQGFDVGRIPVAPGTFGTLVGLVWFAFLLVPGSLPLYLIGTLLGLIASVWFCGEAERILQQADPGSVVLDEIAAIPVCFLPWVWSEFGRLHAMPPVETFFTGRALLMTALVFGLFRAFDILKPWPVRQSQSLPGGLGITVDDFLAALYVAALTAFLLP